MPWLFGDYPSAVGRHLVRPLQIARSPQMRHRWRWALREVQCAFFQGGRLFCLFEAVLGMRYSQYRPDSKMQGLRVFGSMGHGS